MANLGSALRSSEHPWHSASQLPNKRDQRFPLLQLSLAKQLQIEGLSRGILAEVNGDKSSGRTSFFLHVLAESTNCGEVCAVVDLTDNFHPESAAAANVRTDQLIWVRCGGNIEHAMKATDLIVHAGGFGVVLLDLCEASPKALNRIPLSYWYRFRKAIEHTSTIILISAFSPHAKSIVSFGLELNLQAINWAGKRPFLRLTEAEAKAHLYAGSSGYRPTFSSLSREA